MKILVTGGAGFIGSNFIRYILNKYPNYQIINLDLLTYAGNLDNLKDVEKNPHYRFVKGDICDKNLVNKLIKEVEAVIHFAAETHVDRSILGPSEFLRTNVFGTYTLLEAAKEAKISRFIQIGTDEEYGSAPKGYFKESDPLNPSNPYSVSKAAASLLSLSYFRTYNLPVIVLRPTNNFGPYQYPEKIIPLFITNLLENKPIPLYGYGLNRRDWLFVLDNCRAIDLVLHSGKIGEIYNLGAKDNEISNVELTCLIVERLKKPTHLIKFVKDRPGHDFRYALDTRKIEELGFYPEYNLEKGLETTIKWYQENQWWWKKLKNKEFEKYYQQQYQFPEGIADESLRPSEELFADFSSEELPPDFPKENSI